MCSEYNSKNISIRRRKDILDALFPLQCENLIVGDDIFVDCVGTVKIGNNVTLQTTGHVIYYEGRKITTDEKGGLCEILTPGYIIVLPEIIFADGTKVIPDKTVKINTIKDEILSTER